MGRRSPAATGAIGMGALVLATMASFSLSDLPIIGGGTTYTAEFSEAAGLTTADEVRVAGVKVGTVTGVRLDGDHVDVKFRVSDVWIGDASVAAIKVKTLLGQKFLAIDPQGDEAADPSEPIPRIGADGAPRTLAPYDVMEAFSGFSDTVGSIDTDQLAKSMSVLSQAFEGTPDDIRASLDGLSALSKTISDRDAKLKELLSATASTSKILADRNTDIETLLRDGSTLLTELNSRQAAIRKLLATTVTMGQQLRGLVLDNTDRIGPALKELGEFTALLNTHEKDLSEGIALLAPFYRLFANVLGDGRWFNTVIDGLLPPTAPDLNSGREPVSGGN